ncbi:MAG TPA: hypothetical protein VFL69_02190 [Marmoricola sp.]|nr:hypothetical protein [Marmoricola sp.]
MSEPARPVGPLRPKATPGPFVAMGALACLFFLYGASAVFLPWWGVTLLYLLWLVLLVQAARWFTPRPRRILVVPAIGFLAWLLAWALAVWG